MQIPGYKIERLIAEGGMSSVYLAMQESLGRRVALKLLKRFDSPQHAGRFLHEARVIAALQHRNIITIHDVGTLGDRHYIAMEYLEGGSLADRIVRGMRPAEALRLLYRIARCLEFVHRRDIVHRDIKPGNILFHSDGTPKLSDFGIAKQIDADQELTMDGSAFGSPYYISPEQAECRPLDGRSDIYSLGIVFYQMLTGRRPYAEKSHIETIVAHLSQPVPLLPEGLSRYQVLLERMIAKRPEDRVGSARDLLDLIRHTGSPEPGQHAAVVGRRQLGASGGQGSGILERVRRTSVATRVLAVLVLSSLAMGLLLMPMNPAHDRESIAAIDPAPFEQAVNDPRNGAFEQQADVATPETPQILETPETPETPEIVATPQTDEPIEGPVPEVALEAIAGVLDIDTPLATKPAAAQMAEVVDQPEPEQSPEETEAAAIDESGSAGGTRELIDKWLLAGESALQADRLTTPANDNAYAHYLKVIELDPGNTGGREGIDRIADRYVELAGSAIQKKDYRLAALYVRRGNAVRPGDVDLAMIRHQLDEANQLAVNARSDEVADPPEPGRAERRAGSTEFGGITVRTRGPEATGNIAKDFMNVWHSVFD